MSFMMLVLGDSISWGQGLNDADKFSTLVKNRVAGIIKADVDLRIYAHSGATLMRQAKDAVSLWGELPVSFPSIHAQVDRAKNEVKAADVRLVLVDGGINDVSLKNILTVDPTISDRPAWVRKLTRQDIWAPDLPNRPMEDVLIEILTAFPNAFVVVTGYYQILSENSALATVTSSLAPLGLAEILVSSLIQSLVAQAAAFHEESRSSLLGAVSAANTRIGGTRSFFADPLFGPFNALGADQAWVWTGTNDPLFNARQDWYTYNSFTADASPIVPFASMGHPNVEGARRYAEASMIAQWVDQIRPPAPPECNQIRASLTERRAALQQAQDGLVGLNPRYDRGEIVRINAEIKSIQQQINSLKQRGQQLGCPPEWL